MARAFRLRGGAGNGLGGGKVRRDGSQRAASLGFDPQHFGFYLNILAGGEPCELRAAPVDMGAVDQLAPVGRGEIGRSSGRERGGQCGESMVGAVQQTTKK